MLTTIIRAATAIEVWHSKQLSAAEDRKISCRHLQGSIAISHATRSYCMGERLKRNLIHRLLLSLLLAISMIAGLGRDASAMAPPGTILHQHAFGMSMTAASYAGQMIRAPIRPQAAPPHHHHGLAGCACCSMSCCPAVLPSPALLRMSHTQASVAYAWHVESGRGLTAALEPDPPRPSTL